MTLRLTNLLGLMLFENKDSLHWNSMLGKNTVGICCYFINEITAPKHTQDTSQQPKKASSPAFQRKSRRHTPCLTVSQTQLYLHTF